MNKFLIIISIVFLWTCKEKQLIASNIESQIDYKISLINRDKDSVLIYLHKYNPIKIYNPNNFAIKNLRLVLSDEGYNVINMRDYQLRTGNTSFDKLKNSIQVKGKDSIKLDLYLGYRIKLSTRNFESLSSQKMDSIFFKDRYWLYDLKPSSTVKEFLLRNTTEEYRGNLWLRYSFPDSDQRINTELKLKD